MSKHFALQIVMQFRFKEFTTQYKLFTLKIDKWSDVNPGEKFSIIYIFITIFVNKTYSKFNNF